MAASDGALVAHLKSEALAHISGIEELMPKRHGTALGSYEVSCTPELTGDYDLHVLLDGEPISGNPPTINDLKLSVSNCNIVYIIYIQIVLYLYCHIPLSSDC